MDANVSGRGGTPMRATVRNTVPPARQVFRREGEYWTVEYAGAVCRLRDGAGMRYLACLLGRPGDKVAAIELIARHGRSPSASEDTASSRLRTTADSERARVSVTRAIRTALHRLAEPNPALLEHFRATIRTGANCSYAPDPRRPGAWQL